jgi:hypothetical protein
MARKRVYNHNRFDGGMTDSPRDTSNLTKLAYISHLDIYRDPNRMFVMPGFEKVQGFGSDPDGIKAYDLRAFTDSVDARSIYALGTRVDGTGSKAFELNDATGATTWVAGGSLNTIEGADTIPQRPFLAYINPSLLYPVNNAGFLNIGVNGATTYSRFAPATTNLITDDKYNLERGFDNVVYFINPSTAGVRSLTSTTAPVAQSVGGSGRDIATGDYTIGILQQQSDPLRGSVLVWDSTSLLADQNVRLRNADVRAIGYINGSWAIAWNEGLFTGTSSSAGGNGRASIGVTIIAGETPYTIWEKDGFSANIHTENTQFAIKGGYNNSTMFYARMAENVGKTSYLGGVFCVGTAQPESPLAVSQLLNTETLGVVENVYNSGRRFYFSHNNDGSVSRLQRFDTGTYNVPATIETLIYGADSPYLKELNGISVVTENLPSGGSVVVSYRKDEDDAWTTMGTSDTIGKTKHNFTKANGTPIGRFQEIQFRIVITGKTAVKNIMVAVTETDDLSF